MTVNGKTICWLLNLFIFSAVKSLISEENRDKDKIYQQAFS